ncbi:MmyB family transcriptional regulator [Catenuloplanes atrovinosus]|uniref:Transcriptional regulator with XRE-family HTH domain n=1 Tax=Catenuloplanes atrovinosus TaxID=137266 RepID=A0AAE3YNM9_9ACTN|nr:helix-turn-helix domain-containing protein [Catenuloplanes atrovinosus]MDR7275716.1 transcriptional regulator with XRE-family HTH domain [Catenuloplanes atrovinosus]
MDLAALGGFLKSRRDRLSPSDLGLHPTSRRRVPGLRRDEVANLAGASVDYYVQLEQGRGAQPSEQMLAALARALRLTLDERHHLYHLAGRPLPPSGGGGAHVHPGMLELLDRLDTTPAQIISDLSVTLAQNRLAAALLGPPTAATGIRASFIHRWFTDPSARDLYHPDEHDHQSSVFVADIRAVSARRGPDEFVTALIRSLLRDSDEFRRLWARHHVAIRRADRKRLLHPLIGEVELNCTSLLSEDGTQRLLWFTPPPGTPSVERLELLNVIGAFQISGTGDATR